MPQSVDEILAGAKGALSHAENKFPTAQAAATPAAAPAKPSYSLAHAARKAASTTPSTAIGSDTAAGLKARKDATEKALQ